MPLGDGGTFRALLLVVSCWFKVWELGFMVYGLPGHWLPATGYCTYPNATSRDIMIINPSVKAMMPTSECLPADMAGINSSTTT